MRDRDQRADEGISEKVTRRGRRAIRAATEKAQGTGTRAAMPHQQACLAFMRPRRHAGLFLAPGTGKTLIAIRKARRYRPILVICRRDDFMTWQQELAAEGIADKTPGYEDTICFIESGNGCLPWELCDGIGPQWTFITYDLIRNEKVKGFVKAIPWQVCIADECHLLKRWESQRTKSWYRATRHVKRRYGMTGSPITNSPMDAFSQALFIDDGATFGKSWWHCRNDLCIQDPNTGAWYPKKNSKALVAERLSKFAFHVHEDDVLSLPPVRAVTKSAPMSDQQREQTDRVITEWELMLEDGRTIELNEVITQLSKLKQIASGFFYDDQHETHLLDCPKTNVLFDLLSDNDYLGTRTKVVVWCSFSAEIERIRGIADSVNVSNRTFYGEMSRRAKQHARETFRDDRNVRLFIAQVDAGVGMNELIVAQDAVYHSNSHKVVSRQQSERRIRRRGSEHHNCITYWDLVTERSVDLRVLSAVKRHMSVATEILDELKQGRSPREVLS